MQIIRFGTLAPWLIGSLVRGEGARGFRGTGGPSARQSHSNYAYHIIGINGEMVSVCTNYQSNYS